MLKTAP